ncbi:TetR/AcrR family transcriptional regulator [Thermodesulforhabdus norvegica]|uniref:Transcriptional regulator, TetR family n=1 Tax=Thermodesulforhabdus norvegica TaxID=39841 RepID=A0A1I4S3U3_9BACT|nr:TetR/AcrR family transcriptional regulator [Thermodesulforhabdus norvegica]SFM58950.1 transcriptional regulator, TetR family [Thermodesulforhabdus norvegica]
MNKTSQGIGGSEADRRREFIEAALRIVQSEGLSSLSISRLASEVGVVPSALYRHFRSKEELLDAILGFVRENLREHFEDAVGHHFSALSALDELLNRHVNMIKAHGAIPRVLFSEEIVGDSRARRKVLGEIIREHVGRIAGLVKRGQDEGEIRKDLDPEAVALMFLGIVQPAAILWHTSEGEFDFTEYAKQAWRVFRESVTV